MRSNRLLRNLLLIGLPLGLAAAFFVGPTVGRIVSTPPPAPVALPADPRARVVAAAVSQLGQTNPAPYWQDTLATHPASGVTADWCGAFALWCLHQAGLALDWHWEIGSGFLLSTAHQSLPTTLEPLPGDIAYFDRLEHEAIVELVTPAGVGLINGNGTGGAVTRSSVPRSAVTAFFSIAPLLTTAEAA